MKILFLLRHGLYVRNFESTIRELASRGHRMHLGFAVEPLHEQLDARSLARELVAAYPNISQGYAPERNDSWVGLLRDVRSARNLLRYYEPRFTSAAKLRKRIWRSSSRVAQRFVRLPGARTRRGRGAAHGLLRRIERAVAPDEISLRYLLDERPDVLFVSPYVDTKLDQVDLVKAARALGIPTVYGLASWDNLTTKGTVHLPTDRMLVWNEAQAVEAVEIHGVPRERIEITGAQLYDQWFGRPPSRSREDFCALHGFDPERPIALFVGSSSFIAEEELPFVARWIEAIRGSADPQVAQANVLVRPHPTNIRGWSEADFGKFGRVAVWPRGGEAPMSDASKADYFDSLYHAGAVVGVNTSALVEAAIVGRRPLTVLDPAFELTQEGTLHFAHLTAGNYLGTARTLDQHVAQLAGEFRRGHEPAPEAREFVRRFLRPHGADQAATPRVVAAIEQAAQQAPAKAVRGLGDRVIAGGLAPVAWLRNWRSRRPTQDDRLRKAALRRDTKPRRQAPEDKTAALQLEPSGLTPCPGLYGEPGQLQRAIAASRESSPWRNYCRARDYVRRLLQIPTDSASAYWREEMAGFEYLLDASPLVVERLRQHSYHVTGIRAQDFRADDREGRQAMGEKLAALRKLDRRQLLVPESRALGGFGFEIHGELYNVDTLKFFECLLTLDHAGLLPADGETRRRVVLEVGAGWGGFAHQFLTRFRGRATYVIVDLPATMLFSATYLPTVFPDAKIALADEANLEEILAHWSEYDVIFVPAGCWQRVRDLPVELGINMVSFQEMTSRQVDEYAARLADLGCPTLYSLNRERSPHNCELTAVSAILGQYYDLRPLQLIDSQYTQWKSEKNRRRKPRDPAKDASYRHLIGQLKASPPAPVWMDGSRRGAQARAAHRARPRVGLAMPAYNETENLRLALDTLLAQTHSDFRLVVLDDSTKPETGQIVRKYAQADPRVEYRRNPQRLGMVGNWRAGFEALEGQVDYFAWVSDHDLWHPQWLEKHVATLNEFPEVSLVYPASARMDAEGRRVFNPPHALDTFGLTPQQRFDRLSREGRSFGNMVYGLFRAERLREAGVFRNLLLPDVLLIWELSLHGTIKQIHEELWYRRYVNRASLSRQRETLFVDAPAALRFRWPLTHWSHFAWRWALSPHASLADRLKIPGLLKAHMRRYFGDLFYAREEGGAVAYRAASTEPLRVPEPPRREERVALHGPHWDQSAKVRSNASPWATEPTESA